MKKVLAVSSVLLGVVFLAGCGLQPVSQTQPTTPAPAAQTPATNQPVATQSAPTTPANTQNYVEVKELGFKIPVDASMVGELTYKIDSGGGVVFSSKALTATNKFCGDGASGATIAKIQGTPATPKSGDPVFYKAHISDTKQFDGFFLFYQGPQDSCTMGKNVDLEKKVSQAVADGFKNAEASDWKTYTSAVRGFSIKYPPQWYIYDYPGANYVNLQSYQNDPALDGLSKGGTKIQVSGYSKFQSESLRSFVSQRNELTGGAPKVEAFTIAGIQGFKNDYDVGKGVYYFPSSEAEGIKIMLWSASLEISGQILETLKFVP